MCSHGESRDVAKVSGLPETTLAAAEALPAEASRERKTQDHKPQRATARHAPKGSPRPTPAPQHPSPTCPCSAPSPPPRREARAARPATRTARRRRERRACAPTTSGSSPCLELGALNKLPRFRTRCRRPRPTPGSLHIHHQSRRGANAGVPTRRRARGRRRRDAERRPSACRPRSSRRYRTRRVAPRRWTRSR